MCYDCCRVDKVESLGHGSVSHIRSTQDDWHMPAVMSLLALIPAAVVQRSNHYTALQATVALQQLEDAPLLADLEEWVQWEIRCKAALGPLRTFLQEHGNLCHLHVHLFLLQAGDYLDSMLYRHQMSYFYYLFLTL